MLTKNTFGVDLGTSAVKIYSLRKNRLLVEKNMIAVRNGHQVIAAGNDAFEMYEKTPPEIVVDSPVADGRIADVDEVGMLLRLLLQRTDPHMNSSPAICFSVPVNMSGLEKRAYYAACGAGGLRSQRTFMADRPICDAISLGIPILRTRGSMILNMGAQSTSVSVIASGQVIISSSVACGGQQLDEAVLGAVRRERGLMIGAKTAGNLKAVLATFYMSGTPESRKVVGMDALSGLPREEEIPSGLVSEAVETCVRKGAEEIRTLIERMPPQVSKNLMDEGIYLTGGTSRIPGIDQYLSRILECRIKLSGNYEYSTVRGLEEIIKHKEYQKWTYSMKDGK